MFVFYFMLKFGGHILLRNICPARILLAKFAWFDHMQKLRNNFNKFSVKLKKNEWHGKNPTKWLWKNGLGGEFRTRWKLYKMALDFFGEDECKCFTTFG